MDETNYSATNDNEKYKPLYDDYINLAKKVKEKYEKVGVECNIELPESLDDYVENLDYYDGKYRDLMNLKYSSLEKKKQNFINKMKFNHKLQQIF